MSASDLKQQILHEYNRIHRELFGLGLREQSIEFSTNKIIIFDVSTRAPVLTTITSTHPALVSRMDDLLLEIYKEKLAIHFRKTLQLNIVAILKDYDAATEYSGTIIVLDRDVCCYYE